MTMDEIINYAIHSPENSNPNVLRSMLNQISSENGDSSNDIEVIDFNVSMEAPYTLDITWQEVYDALSRGAIIRSTRGRNPSYIITADNFVNEYTVTVAGMHSNYDTFVAETTSDYPILTTSESLPGGNTPPINAT